MSDKTQESMMEDDEFSLLLKEFVDSALDDDNDDQETTSFLNDEEEDEEEKDEDEEINLEDFPEGSVEFNEKNTVKVEILKPLRNPRKKLDQLVGCKNIKQRLPVHDQAVQSIYFFPEIWLYHCRIIK